jgi:hypothetical protein
MLSRILDTAAVDRWISDDKYFVEESGQSTYEYHMLSFENVPEQYDSLFTDKRSWEEDLSWEEKEERRDALEEYLSWLWKDRANRDF